MKVLGAVVLLLVALATVSARKHIWGTERERSVAISEAMSEAKLSAQLKEEVAKAKEAAKAGKFTAADFLTRGFKKPSPEALKEGKARLLLEDMVKRAEKKLAELKRSHLHSQSTEEEAEEIAEELVHTPGTLLIEKEIAKLFIESGCEDERTRPTPRRCRRRPNINVFRTINGVCNNLRNPTQGAQGTNFRRLIPGIYEDGISVPLGRMQAQNVPEEEGEEEIGQLMRVGPFVPPRPSARLISKSVVRDRQNDELPFTHILMQWGQFLDHDLDLGPEIEAECEGCEFTDICEPIRVPKDDQVFGVGTSLNGECLPFRRSLPSCDTDTPGSFSPREQLNDLTSYIDGSMVYGSTRRVANAVRSGSNGLLRVGPKVAGRDSLPVDTEELVACLNAEGCFLCGDLRCNEQISLTIMHTVWVREHNRIARELLRLNPEWDDERVYQEARKIVGALIQKITYIDYLPKVLGPAVFDQVIGRFKGYNDTVDASVPNAFATAAYRYGHSLIRPFFDRLDGNFNPLPIGPLNLRDAFFNPKQFSISGGAAPILRGLVTANARRVDEFMNTVLTTQLFEQEEKGSGMDLAALNIQRSRDHGLPGYLIWRNFCQRIFNLTSDTENQLTFVRFLQLYGSLETVELWVGGLAEDRLPNSLLGATFACIFGLTFRNVRDGDRFYFEEPGVFTPQQLTEIRKGTFSRVLCDTTNINRIQPDAFLSNQTRQSCSNLPSVDLTAWQEDNRCYARVGLPSQYQGLTDIAAFYQFVSGKCLITYNEISNCIPFECPTGNIAMAMALIYTNNLSGCRATPASGLPNNECYYRQDVYFTSSLPYSLMTPSYGFYRSAAACQAGSVAAVTFNDACVSPYASMAQAGEEPVPNSPDNDRSGLPDPDDLLNGQPNSASRSQAPIYSKHSMSEKDLLTILAEDMEKLN